MNGKEVMKLMKDIDDTIQKAPDSSDHVIDYPCPACKSPGKILWRYDINGRKSLARFGCTKCSWFIVV